MEVPKHYQTMRQLEAENRQLKALVKDAMDLTCGPYAAMPNNWIERAKKMVGE
jgi:hypothetical protein